METENQKTRKYMEQIEIWKTIRVFRTFLIETQPIERSDLEDIWVEWRRRSVNIHANGEIEIISCNYSVDYQYELLNIC